MPAFLIKNFPTFEEISKYLNEILAMIPHGPPGPQGEQGIQGIKGEPGSTKDCWPIDSVFSCVVDTDPEKLFGFGKWELVAKEPFYAWQRKE
jgi:hypothetical protein